MPSCTFTVPGCCEHDHEDSLVYYDPDTGEEPIRCPECGEGGEFHLRRAPVLCGHEESEHEEIFDGAVVFR